MPSSFRDTNRDGIDDSQQDQDGRNNRNSNQRDRRRRDSSNSNNDTQRILQGMTNFRNNLSSFFSPASREETRRSGLQDSIMASQIDKSMDAQRSSQQAQEQSGLFRGNARFAANLELRNNMENRADEFGYGMRNLDRQFELQDEYQNRQLGRRITDIQATNDQTRRNYRAQGVENRLQTITEGEQDRLGTAATGDQTRKTNEHSDMLTARGEERNRRRANQLSRSF